MIEVEIHPPQEGNYVDKNASTIFALNRLRENILSFHNGTTSTIAEIEIVKFAAGLTKCIETAVTKGTCVSEDQFILTGNRFKIEIICGLDGVISLWDRAERRLVPIKVTWSDCHRLQNALFEHIKTAFEGVGVEFRSLADANVLDTRGPC
jgi:hypothetical protein